MSLYLPIPLTPDNAPQWKAGLEREDNRNQKTGSDVIIGKLPNEPRGPRLILVDPSGGQWSITVDTSGALHTIKITIP